MGIIPELYFRFIQLLRDLYVEIYTAGARFQRAQPRPIVPEPGDLQMRSRILFLASLPLFLASPVWPAASDDAVTLPERKAGLWELKTVMDEGNGPRDQTMKLCIDAQMEKNTVRSSVAEHKANCSTYNVKTGNGSTTVDSDCLYNQRQVMSTTTMSGDFQTAFEIKIQSTTSDPEKKNQSVVIKRTITQLGKYLGDACGDLKPGEAQSADGTRILVQ